MKASIGVLCLLLLGAIAAGCGGDSSSGGGATGEKVAAANSPQARKLIKQTFGANDKARSGLLSGRLDISVKGVPRFRKPIAVTVSGPFRQPGRRDPVANFSVGLELKDKIYGADLILVKDEVLIGLGSTAYLVPPDIAARMRRPLRNSDNALSAVLGVFRIEPGRWAKSPRIVGNEKIAGEEVVHASAGIHADRVFRNVAELVNILTDLRFTEVAGLPLAIGPKARAALVRSVTSASADLYSGADDKVMRRATFKMAMKMSAKDRRRLGGISSVDVKGDITTIDVGAPAVVDAPTTRGSYAALQVSLDALSEAAQQEAQEGQ
jgi:hypothetical protein